MDRLDRALGASRTVLMRRYVAAERQLPRNGPIPSPAQAEAGGQEGEEGEEGKEGRAEPRARRWLRQLQRGSAASRSLSRAGGPADGRPRASPATRSGSGGSSTAPRLHRRRAALGLDRAGVPAPAAPPALGVPQPGHAAAAPAARAPQVRQGQQPWRRRGDLRRPTGGRLAQAYLDWARRQQQLEGDRHERLALTGYSEQVLPLAVGAPSCPGTCAGRGSNHAGRVKPAGAIDVSDIPRFAALMQRCPPRRGSSTRSEPPTPSTSISRR